MKHIFKYCLFLALFSGVLIACDKDDEPCDDRTNPECANYDPCWNKVVTADFKMRQTSPGFVIPEDLQAEWCDTILGSGVEFLADMEEALSYTWQIGTETEPRFGRNLKLSFQSYLSDLSSYDPDVPDYRIPLPITLTVRNAPGGCVNESDTVLSVTRQVVFAMKSLTAGTFRGRVEGESFDRDIIFWEQAGLDNPDPTQWVSQVIGFPHKDTLIFTIHGSIIQGRVRSYKQLRWDEDWQNYSTAQDGVRKWNQQIATSAIGPDRVDLYFERIPEDNSGLQTVKFSGYRIE